MHKNAQLNLLNNMSLVVTVLKQTLWAANYCRLGYYTRMYPVEGSEINVKLPALFLGAYDQWNVKALMFK